MIASLLLVLAAQMSPQVTPMQPLPKGTGLPPPGTEEAQVMAPVTALLAGISARDAAAIGRALRVDAPAPASAEKPDGTRTVTHSTRAELLAIARRLDPLVLRWAH